MGARSVDAVPTSNQDILIGHRGLLESSGHGSMAFPAYLIQT